jgi:hypothetical protein
LYYFVSFDAEDTDIDYYTLKEVIGDHIAGLGTLLKNMKEQGLLEYNSRLMLKDDTIITLINDYYQEFNSLMVTYDRIQAEVPADVTSHQKTNY